MAVADDGGDSRERCEFFRGPLGVAARGNDASFWIAAVNPANPCAGFAVSLGGDATGVHDYDVGMGGERFASSGTSKESGYRFSISTGGATAEVLDVEG